MRSSGAAPTPPPRQDGHAEPNDAQPNDAPSWRHRARYPVVLRIPRGYAVLLGVAAVGLLLLAYQTGYSRGTRSTTQPQTSNHTYPPLANPVAQPVSTTTTTPPAAQPIPEPVPRPDLDKRVVSTNHDPRELGMNYFVLAHYPRAEAERLVRFLGAQGVAAAAYRPENKQFFQVVALKGFSRSEVSGPGPTAFRQRLHRLGRMWVAKHKGAEDFSQSGIYLAKYKGGDTPKS